ncbi:MAG: hypothetical protein QM751_10270 [Paludibacteraceae bacterium]
MALLKRNSVIAFYRFDIGSFVTEILVEVILYPNGSTISAYERLDKQLVIFFTLI